MFRLQTVCETGIIFRIKMTFSYNCLQLMNNYNFLINITFFITYPVKPSTESSIGSMCTRFPYLTDGHGAMDTTSDRRTRRLLRTTRFMRIFSSGQLSSESTMHTVSLRRLPFSSTVSPRKSCSCSIFA